MAEVGVALFMPKFIPDKLTLAPPDGPTLPTVSYDTTGAENIDDKNELTASSAKF